MTVKEACEKLRISRVTLYRRIEEGALTPLPKAPGAKINYPMRFKSEDIERLARGETQTT